MRVIAGTAGGIPLLAPRTDLRPTMDRVKAAIFSSLGELVIGANVLDLFAGTGSLGIEALSRGAASAVFVEKDTLAVETLRKNLVKTRLTGAIQTLDIFSFLDRLAPPETYDLIFADPPYAKKTDDRDFASELLQSASLQRSLTTNGIFILENRPGAKMAVSEIWESIRNRRYGATEVTTFRKRTR